MDGEHHLAGAAVCRKAGPCWRRGGEVREVQARRTETSFMPVAQHGWLVGRHDASDQGRPSREPPTSPPPRPGLGLGLGQQRRTRHWSPDRQAASTFASSRYCQPAAHSGRAFCTPSPVCADEGRVPFSPFFVGPWWTAVGEGERERARRSANPTPSRLISMLQPAKDLLNRTAWLHVARTRMTTVFIQPIFPLRR